MTSQPALAAAVPYCGLVRPMLEELVAAAGAAFEAAAPATTTDCARFDCT